MNLSILISKAANTVIKHIQTKAPNRFAIQEDHPTGHCVALVRGAERTLLAQPGAADHFGLADLDSSGILRTLKSSEDRIVVYVEGFFAIHSWDVTVRLAEVTYLLSPPFHFAHL